MSVLSDFEDSVSRAIEGVFAGVFRSRVQPAEIAKALGKEMDRGRTVGVDKVYAPNLYTVVVSEEDESRLGSFVDTLAAELATYLVGYAREKGYSLDGRPVVRFAVHDSLRLGRFEAVGELVSAKELAEAADAAGFYVPDAAPAARPGPRVPEVGIPATPPAASTPVVPRPGPGVTIPPSGARRSPRATIRALSTITIAGVDHDVVLQGPSMVVGRLSTADIPLPDANVSRRHAALVAEEDGWAVEDLGSTNGTFVNGVQISRRLLRDGDVIGIGVTELVYHEPRR